jgi:hypothetical protein
MYDMYPATWRVVDDKDRKAHRQAPPRRPDRDEPVQEAMNRRDNGGEPAQ